MFTVTASWHIWEPSSSYNDWESDPDHTFKSGLDKLFDMIINTDKHQCPMPDDYEPDMDDEDEYFTTLNMHRGIYLVQDGHTSFSGGPGQTVPLPLEPGDTGTDLGWPLCNQPQPVRANFWQRW